MTLHQVVSQPAQGASLVLSTEITESQNNSHEEGTELSRGAAKGALNLLVG